MYRLPPGATVRYQYSIFDSVQTERATLSAEEASSMSRAMPRLDMLVILPNEIRLVELKPNAQLKDVGQVLQYERYLMRDIFLKPHLNQPVKRVLCSMIENASVRAACVPEGIEYIVIPQSELPPLIE
jgi:hypothetical protein